MAWKEPAERHSDDLITAIGHAAHLIATTIEKGFAHMADAETQALADLSTAITNIGNAIAAEITALQAALAAATPPVDNSPAIEAAVTNLNNLTASLKASVPGASQPSGASAPPPAAAPTA